MIRLFFLCPLVLSLVLAFGYHSYSGHQPFDLRNGDLVFQNGGGNQAKAVMAATGSPWTHVGVVLERHGKWFVLEAVQPVKYTKLDDFVRRSPDSFCVMRLKEGVAMDPFSSESTRRWVDGQLGKNYDLKFEWNDKTLYCSELVWKLYKEAGIELCMPRMMEEYHLEHSEVKTLIKSRYGKEDALNAKELVVAPSDLAESELLFKLQ